MLRRKMIFKKNKIIFSVLIIIFAVLIVSLKVEAGSLTPSASPGSTMKTLEEIYNPLAGTFDSSSISADLNGSALQIAQCAIEKIQGAVCE